MSRRSVLALCAAALIPASCGRQVTPNPPGTTTGLQPGFMLLRFTAAGPMDFTSTRYVMIFNTSGKGGMPYANVAQTNFQNYSFAITIGQNAAGQIAATMTQYLQGIGPVGTVPPQVTLVTNSQQLQLQPNSNGQGSQFTVIVELALFRGTTPTSAPSATPTATPTPTPTPSPTGAPSATPSPSPTPLPFASQWFINFFTTDLNGNALDAPGINGVQNTSFTGNGTLTFPVDVTTSFDGQFTNPDPSGPSPGQTIQGAEVANNPIA